MAETATVKDGFFGLKNAHIAWLKEDGTYDTPISVPGIRSLKLTADSSAEKQYADDTVWAVLRANQGFTGDVVFFDVAEDIVAKMTGGDVDTNGALLGITNGVPAHFALMAEEQAISGNGARSVYYNCTVSRPDKEATTKEDKPSLKEQTFSITAVPVTIGARELDHATLRKSSANAAVYNAFFTKVYQPDQAAS